MSVSTCPNHVKVKVMLRESLLLSFIPNQQVGVGVGCRFPDSRSDFRKMFWTLRLIPNIKRKLILLAQRWKSNSKRLASALGIFASVVFLMVMIGGRLGRGRTPLPNYEAVEEGFSFYQSMDAFPWNDFLLAVEKDDKAAVYAYSSRLLIRLTPFLLLEPKAPINHSCIPPPLVRPVCQDQGERTRSKPRKIGILVQFGFDLDVLEMYLNEVYDVVDKFFILESSRTYSYLFKKSLIWERAKNQPRFANFSDKIVHFTMDDSETTPILNSKKRKMYTAENLQEKARWTKFLKWNEATKFFGEDDLLGFGDSDEIPARRVINYLKYCRPPSDPVDVGIWVTLGQVSQTMAADWPVRDHPFTLGDPTFWSLKKAMANATSFGKRRFPTRNRGNSESFLIGGTHVTDYPYLPNTFAKRLTSSEQRLEYIRVVASYRKMRKEMSVEELESFYAKSFYYNYWRALGVLWYWSTSVVSLNDVPENALKDMYLPWFYECNKARYPVLEGMHDDRLD